MGFLDVLPSPIEGAIHRVMGLGHAVYQSSQAPFGLLADFAKAPFVDDPAYDGFVHTLFGRTIARGADVMVASAGPKGFGGNLVGALPSQVRDPGRAILHPVMEVSNWLYDEGISQPLSTLLLVGDTLNSKTARDRYGLLGRLGNIDALFNGDVWRDAYDQADDTSPGGALAFWFGNVDIKDQREMDNFMATDFYQVSSGVTDALARWYLDPQVLAGHALHAGRAAMSVRGVDASYQAIRNERDLIAWVNGAKEETDRWRTLLQSETDPDRIRVLTNMITDQELALGQAGFPVDRYISTPLNNDIWRAGQLTDEVTPWYQRTQESYRLAGGNSMGPTARSRWAREAMEDLNSRLARPDMDTATRRVVGQNPDGTPIVRLEGGDAIGGRPFEPTQYPNRGLGDMTPERLLRLADFGPGVDYAMETNQVLFQAVARGYADRGESLSRVAFNPGEIGQDLVHKPWTSSNGVVPNSLLNSIGSQDAKVAGAGVGAPAATAVDANEIFHTSAGGPDKVMYAVSFGDRAPGSVIRSNKRINMHPDFNESTTLLVSNTKAKVLQDNWNELSTLFNGIADDFKAKSIPTGVDDYVMYAHEKAMALNHNAAEDAIQRFKARHPGEWANSPEMINEYLNLFQQSLGGPTIQINIRRPWNSDQIHWTNVSRGQVAGSESRLTSPVVWDRNLQQYVRQQGFYEVHGDIRVQAPPLIPARNPTPPAMVQAGIDRLMMPTQRTRSGLIRRNAVPRINADIQGRLHQPDLHYTGAEELPRDYVSYSKMESEARFNDRETMDWHGRKDMVPLADQVAPWTVPDTLYHTTAAADSIEQVGKIEGRLGGGFGQDPYNLRRPGISLTNDSAAAAVNENWLKNVLAPAGRDLGETPTERQIIEWLKAHETETGVPAAQVEKVFSQYSFADLPDPYSFETVMNIFAIEWKAAHHFNFAPELLVNVQNEAIARMRPENVKTYSFKGPDLVELPGELTNPLLGNEFRYYGDINIGGRASVPQGGYASWAEDTENAILGMDIHDVMGTKVDSRTAMQKAEAIRPHWEYDRNNPGPVPQSKIEQTAAYIRHRYFPNQAGGDIISWALAAAKNNLERNLVWRVFLGDFRALKQFEMGSTALRKALEEYSVSKATIRQRIDNIIEMDMADAFGRSQADMMQAQLDDINAVIDETSEALASRDSIVGQFGSISKLPNTGWRRGLASGITGSDVYQMSAWTAPIRVFTNMVEHRVLNVNMPDADVQFARMLTNAGSTPEFTELWRGRFMAAPTPELKAAVLREADDTLIRARAAAHGMTRDEMDDLIRTATRGRQKAAGIIRRQQYDAYPKNSLVPTIEGQTGLKMGVVQDGGESVIYPLYADSQTSQAVVLTDFRALDKALGPIGQWKARYGGLSRVVDVPIELANGVQTVWRSAVLLRPAWTIRVISDEQLRIMAKIGGMATMAASWNGIKGLTNYTMKQLGLKEVEVPNIVRELEVLPEPTAVATFAARVQSQSTTYDKWAFARSKWKEAERTLAERKQRAIDAAELADTDKTLTNFSRYRGARAEYESAKRIERELKAQMETYQARLDAEQRLTQQAYDQVPQPVAPPAEPAPQPPSMEELHNAGVRGRQNKVGAIGGAAIGGLVAGPYGAAAGALAGPKILRSLAKLDEGGYNQLGLNARRVAGAFGPPGDKARSYAAHVSSRDQLYEFMTKAERQNLEGFRIDPYSWRTVMWDDPAYGPAWTNAVKVINEDRLGRMILEDHSPEGLKAAEHWLLDSVEGRAYAAQLPMRRGWEREWVAAVDDQARRYTANYDEAVVNGVLGGNPNSGLLANVEQWARPPVHGPQLLEVMGQGVWKRFTDKIDQAFFALGTAPTDFLSRQPYFAAVYEAEMRRHLEPLSTGKVERLSEKTLKNFEDQARAHALTETRYLLYDMAERSQFAEMARFFMPFFGAWQEVLTRWVGLAVENPVFAVRATQVFGAPNKIPGMTWTDPETGQDYVQFRIPEIAKDLINMGPLKGGLDSEGKIRFAKSSISMLASGTPGFGPFVNLAISEVAKSRPELTESLSMLLPFGVSTSPSDAFMPSAFRRGISLVRGTDDAAFASSYHQVLVTRLTQILDHQDPNWTPQDLQNLEVRQKLLDEVMDETRKLYAIRLVSAYVSPAALQFDTLYKPLMEEYQALREQNPDTADDVFLQRHGQELVYLTQAATKTNNGVPPTLQGYEAEQKFGNLIAQYPEYGSVIVGREAGGESAKFMAQVYDKQLRTPVEPGSDVMQRERLSPLETIQAPEIRLGWQTFSRYMDQIDAYMVQHGLTTYQQAPNVREFKNELVRQLAQQYPAWGEEYFQRDERKWDKRLEAFRAMTQTPGLQDRPDIQGVSEYLQGRDLIMEVLADRAADHDKDGKPDGSASLFAQSNVDVYNAWMAYRMALKEKNLQFADLYNRYLDRDPLTEDPLLGTSE